MTKFKNRYRTYFSIFPNLFVGKNRMAISELIRMQSLQKVTVRLKKTTLGCRDQDAKKEEKEEVEN